MSGAEMSGEVLRVSLPGCVLDTRELYTYRLTIDGATCLKTLPLQMSLGLGFWGVVIFFDI